MWNRVVMALVASILCVSQVGDAAGTILPRPDHVVMVIMENHSFDQIMDPMRAPFISDVAANGALFINAFAVAHPSQPNYLALFSGSTQGVRDNNDHSFDAPNLSAALDAVGKSFLGYVENGSPRKHNPWQSFNNARRTERNLAALPSDFTQLPTVAFIIPNLNHDMHGDEGESPKHNRDTDERLIHDGDTWLKDNLGAYIEWAKTHNSLLILTFDEDDDQSGNHIPTVIIGAHVQADRYAEQITHYNVFSTLLAMYALPPFAHAVTNSSIYSIWEK